MACEYFVNGEWISENQFKEILIGDESGGLLDALINSGKVEMKGFPTVDAPVRETLRNNTIPVQKLQAMLIKEVKSRKGYPINILSALELNKEGTDFKIPLWSSNYADKFESLLTSIVNNNVIKQKFNGHSYILGSEEGFTLKEGDDAENELSRSGIVYTDSFDPKIGLQPMRIGENGEILPAQIMIPFNFKNKDQYGNKLKLKDFMIPGTNKIDLSKLDPKMLKLFGFRIPTQGHNSMSTVEIVGFLPEASGDLVLAPKDFTVQMGSDFDVDKLYTYMYNVQLKEGKLTTEFSEDNIIENAQNAILDIHHSVLTNPDSNIVSAILKPDGFGDFKDLSSDVVDNRTTAGTLKQTLTILSDSYQKKKFISGTAGKDGCLGYGTKVLMYDGRFKEVQDVIVGDQLMGIDSTPRNVTSLKRGVEQMYIVQQKRGINYRVNESHILSLKEHIPALYSKPVINNVRVIDKSKLLREKQIITNNIKVSDYLLANNDFKRRTKGYKNTSIEFPDTDTPISPYYLGLWLGDGVTKDIKEIATIDELIENYLALTFGISSVYGPNNISKRVFDNGLNDNFKKIFNVSKCGLLPGCKHIPDSYLYTSKENRLSLLAGLIDSDGHYCKINKQYTFSNINEKLINQVAFLTRSLGFYTAIYRKEAQISKRGLNEQVSFKVNFVATYDIPVLLERKKQLSNSVFKNRLYTGITLKKDVVDNYYGFTLDGDHLFMLEDFTVTHNTGSFSLDATFNAIIQGKDLFFFKPETVGLDKFGKYSRDEQIAMTRDTFTLGNLSSDGDLSNPYNLKSQKILNSVNGDINKLSKEQRAKLKFKSDVIQGLQSSAVDNANEEILDKINITSQTFDAIRGMAQLGFEESEIVGLMTQDIMWEYVDFVKSRKSSLKEEFASGDSYEDFLSIKKKQYDPNGDFDKLTQEQINTLSSKSGTQLIDVLISKQLVDVKEGSSTPLSNLEQFAILDKFIKFSEVGKAIKTVQSTINTESSGLPKNLLETNAKIEQIKRLPLSPIVGATKLLGEFDNNNNLVNPTTINGFAAYHGAILADKMYAKYFPYTTNGFTTQYNELLEHIAGEEVSDSKRVDIKINAFKEMRSYLFTSGALNIYDGNAEGVQRRLFIDIPGEHQSLSSILKTIKGQNKQWFNNNQFLNKLLFEPRVDGKVSRVDFQAATGENYDEQAIYLGFMQLFQLDTQVLDTKFNGEDYTPARLAHELVMYAYLEGGSQGSKSFMKYIPIEYLKSQRFGEGLQSLSSFDYNSIFGGSGVVAKYVNPSRFTVQYFQNNPNNAKKLTLEDIDTNHKSITAVDNFKLKPDAIAGNMVSYTNELGEKTNTQTGFVAIYDSKLKSKYALYQYDNVEHVYKRIPVVSGAYGFKQYNINGDITKPVQTANEIVAPNTINVKQPSTPSMNPVPVQPVQGYNPNIVNNNNPIEKVGGLEINRKLGSDAEIITDFFLQIANNPAVPKYYQELAKEYYKLKLPHGIKLQGTDKGKGSYNAGTNVLKLNKEELNVEGALETAITILHESTHIFTSAVIKNYGNLKGEQKEAVTRLNGLMNKYIAFLNKSGKGPQREAFRQAYNDWKNAKESGDNTMIPSPEFTKDNLNEFYGSIKLEEFVAMAQTSKEFQQILNNVIDSDGKSFLSKMMEQIGKILKSIGINLNKNSLLYSTLEGVQNLIDVNQKNVESSTETEPAQQLTDLVKPKFNPFDGRNLNPNDLIDEQLLPLQEDLEEFKRMCK